MRGKARGFSEEDEIYQQPGTAFYKKFQILEPFMSGEEDWSHFLQTEGKAALAIIDGLEPECDPDPEWELGNRRNYKKSLPEDFREKVETKMENIFPKLDSARLFGLAVNPNGRFTYKFILNGHCEELGASSAFEYGVNLGDETEHAVLRPVSKDRHDEIFKTNGHLEPYETGSNPDRKALFYTSPSEN